MALLGMGDENNDGLDELERPVFERRFLVGLVRQLLVTYPTAGSGLAEDAVAEAVKKVVVRIGRPPPVKDIQGYLAKVAHTTLKRAAKKVVGTELPIDERDDAEMWSAEDDVVRAAQVKAVKAHVRTWDNANMREVMLIFIDSIALGEPIEADERGLRPCGCVLRAR